MPREGWQSTCTLFMVFLLFLRHYAVNFLHLYLVKETEPNKTFPCPQRGHPSPLRGQLKLTPLTSHSSLCLQAHSTQSHKPLPHVPAASLCFCICCPNALADSRESAVRPQRSQHPPASPKQRSPISVLCFCHHQNAANIPASSTSLLPLK